MGTTLDIEWQPEMASDMVRGDGMTDECNGNKFNRLGAHYHYGSRQLTIMLELNAANRQSRQDRKSHKFHHPSFSRQAITSMPIRSPLAVFSQVLGTMLLLQIKSLPCLAQGGGKLR